MRNLIIITSLLITITGCTAEVSNRDVMVSNDTYQKNNQNMAEIIPPLKPTSTILLSTEPEYIPHSSGKNSLGVLIDVGVSQFANFGFIFSQNNNNFSTGLRYIGEKSNSIVVFDVINRMIIDASYSIPIESISYEELNSLPGLGDLVSLFFTNSELSSVIYPWMNSIQFDEVNHQATLCLDGLMISYSKNPFDGAITIRILLPQNWEFKTSGCD